MKRANKTATNISLKKIKTSKFISLDPVDQSGRFSAFCGPGVMGINPVPENLSKSRIPVLTNMTAWTLKIFEKTLKTLKICCATIPAVMAVSSQFGEVWLVSEVLSTSPAFHSVFLIFLRCACLYDEIINDKTL